MATFVAGLSFLAIASAPLAARSAEPSWPPGARELALHGNAKMPSCASCHGTHFEGDEKQNAPALAGKSAAAMMDSLYDMATNSKDHSPMAKIARKLNMAERAAVTAWLSRLPARP